MTYIPPSIPITYKSPRGKAKQEAAVNRASETSIQKSPQSNVVQLPLSAKTLSQAKANQGRAAPQGPKKPSPSSTPREQPVTAPSKRCAKCGERKILEQYPKHSSSTDGYASYCRDCKNALAKERRIKDPLARLRHYIVTRIKNEFGKADSQVKVPDDIHTNLEDYLGYKLHALVKHLRQELRERENITLIASFRDGYHLDHRKPHSSFRVQKIGDEAFRACWDIQNLWMIPAKTNLQKGKKQDFFDGEKE